MTEALDDARLDDLVAFAERLAEAARGLLLAAAAEVPEIEIKADGSPVTAADRAIEARLRAMISERFPDHGIIGEEHGAERADAELLWAIDPIDGTKQFIAGIPVFGTLIGLAHAGRPLLGVIDQPVSGNRWIGCRGRPTMHNGAAVEPRRRAGLAEAYLTNGGPDGFEPAERDAFDRLRRRVRYTQYGGGSGVFGLLASGRIDLATGIGADLFDRLSLGPVVEGAGGCFTDWHGGPVEFDPRGRVLAAGDPALHREALAALDWSEPRPS
jgi:inositol-phosphate phosphatase/L-galactose 1-phosphate phosphatase/histidinol-phosphatase